MKAIVRYKEGQYIMIKETIQQEDITLVNIDVPNIEATKYIKQIVMDVKGEINRNTVIVVDFNMPLNSMARSIRQKMNKDRVTLNDTLDQMDLIDTFKAFYPKTADYAYFSSTHGTCSRVDHMVGHKTSFNKFKEIEIISSISLTTML